MRREPANLNSDDIKGVAALTEITAMARIGGFEIGKTMTLAEINSLKRDASRARRRGKTGRSEELEKRATHYQTLLARIDLEQELELVRTPIAATGECLVTGRLTDAGQLQDCLRVDLMDVEGKSLDHDVTDESGTFTLRTTATDSAPLRIVISNGKGATLRTEVVPKLDPSRPVFLEIDLAGATPRKPTEPPADDTSANMIEVPAVTGLPAKQAAAKVKAAGLDTEIQERAVDGAEPGAVVKQAPAAGSRVVRGHKVKLLVAASGGQKLPRLTGRSLRTIPKKLSGMELKLGNVELVHDPDNAGKVVDQAPVQGSSVSPGAAVSVRVATGDDKTDMQVAKTLVANDARGVGLKLSEKVLTQAFRKAKVTTVAELREFAKRSAAEIAKQFDITGRSRAAAARSLLADVSRRFPSR